MARVLKRDAAKRNLIRHFVYLAENASLETARHFRDAARDAFNQLSEMPEMGSPGNVRQSKFAGVRLWRVGGFERYIIAYHPLKDGVVIDRVFHASQDYQRILK